MPCQRPGGQGRIPALAATVERRLLVNYQAAPDVVAVLLPAPLRPRLVAGAAVVGICLIRLSAIRPAGLPGSIGPLALGFGSENAAHRIAVEWEDASGVTRVGVYIPNRRTSSRATVLLGGRVFPGVHRRSQFTVTETPDDVAVAFRGDPEDDVLVDVAATVTEAWPGSALFADLAQASQFFAEGGAGYSATYDPHRLDGIELRTNAWSLQAAVVHRLRSSFFDDPRRFPTGTLQLDTALLMRQLPVTWHGLASLRIEPRKQSAAGPRL